jgi:hypothetical protein
VRSPLALLVVALTGLGVAACGGAGDHARSTSSMLGSVPSQGGSTTTIGASPSAGIAQPRLRNDGDNERPGDDDGDNSHDIDNDSYLDYRPAPDNSVYHDADDGAILSFGRPASVRDTRAISAAVSRYYAAALAHEGSRACSMIDPGLARAVPLDYGRLGPSYLHGGKTCAAVLERLFKHEQRQLPAAIQITDVRVDGDAGLAFFGSRAIAASDIFLERKNGSWKIEQLLGGPLT